MSPNYQYTSAILRNGGDVNDHRSNRSKIGNIAVRKTYDNGRKIKTVKDSTNSDGVKVLHYPFGVPIPYPNTSQNLKEDEKFKDISFRSKKLLMRKK